MSSHVSSVQFTSKSSSVRQFASYYTVFQQHQFSHQFSLVCLLYRWILINLTVSVNVGVPVGLVGRGDDNNADDNDDADATRVD